MKLFYKSFFLAAISIFFISSSCEKNSEKPSNEISGKYDVGGHKLYFHSMGINQPTVILESGFGDGGTMAGWDVVQKNVQDFAKVILYDRAGLGQSEVGPGPRSTLQIANELHVLLDSTKTKPPYILVGHSMGGLHIQVFAMLYPSEVAGMVFVDPTPKELVDTLTATAIKNLIEQHAPQGVLDETGQGLNVSIPIFISLPKLPDVPIVVLTSSYTGQGGIDKSQWEELKNYHQILSEDVTDGTHIVSTKSSHNIQIDEPDLVINAIKSVYEKVESNKTNK